MYQEQHTDKVDRVGYGNKVFKVSLWGNGLLATLKGVIGVIFGSTAMVADALHSMSDVLTSLVAVGGVKFAHRPPDEDHHYGHGKAEIIATKILAIILIITGIAMGVVAINVMREHVGAVPGVQAVWGAIISIIIKEWMFQYTYKIGIFINSKAIVADAWHHRSDVWSSLAALVGIVGALNGYPILDPLAALVVAAMIFRMGAQIYWSSLKDLMDPAPDQEIVGEIAILADAVAGVRGVHDVKARYNGVTILVDMKICVDPLVTVEAGHQVAAECRKDIREKITKVGDVLVHVNPCYEKTADYSCDCCSREIFKPTKIMKKEENN